jgi:ubiquinone/menaquinone biosynthesis C-methylase UbiE
LFFTARNTTTKGKGKLKLEKLQKDWDSIARVDALWSILFAAEKKGGKWDVDEFFQNGVKEIEWLRKRITELGIEIKYRNALDFGCGAGRLTQAMADYFGHCYGIDISQTMIDMAVKYNKHGDKASYIVNSAEGLELFSSDFFDLIYSSITLQHIKPEYVKQYIREFLRTLKPGGLLVFQLINYLPLRYRLQPKRRLFTLLRKIGLPARFLFYRMDLSPIQMCYEPESEILDLIKESGCVKNIDRTKLDSGIVSNVYFITK